VRKRRASESTVAELESLYRSRHRAFVRVAAGVTGDEGLAGDAVHEAFVRAVLYARRLRRVESLEAWMWRIVLNEAHRRREREGRFVSFEPAALPEGPATNGDRPDERVRALVAALPERQRLALFLRYYADLSYDDIARALDVAPGTVAATLNAAHAAVRTQLEEVHR
jgi:RNA polymerase sigma factor (sigma-70 family)